MIDRVLHPEVVVARLATARTLLDHLASLGTVDADHVRAVARWLQDRQGAGTPSS